MIGVKFASALSIRVVSVWRFTANPDMPGGKCNVLGGDAAAPAQPARKLTDCRNFFYGAPYCRQAVTAPWFLGGDRPHNRLAIALE